MNLAKEIHNFMEVQKTRIPEEMFILWEYKLSKTQGTKKDLFSILKSDNVYLKTESDSINYNDLTEKDFWNSLSLYKENNKKLFSFCSRFINSVNF